MKYSQLAVLLTVLVSNFGPVSQEEGSCLQEDCAGEGNLSRAAKLFGMRANKRDVFWLNYGLSEILACFQEALMTWN